MAAAAVLTAEAVEFVPTKAPATHERMVENVFAAPPFKRTKAVPIEDLPGRLPEAVIPKDVDPAEVVSAVLARLEESFSPDLFISDALWRDLYAMTGTFRTFSNITTIAKAWADLAPLFRPCNFRLIQGTANVIQFGKHGWLQARFTFKTRHAREAECSGQVGLIPDIASGRWRMWFISTILEEISGMPNPDRMNTDVHRRNEHAKDPGCDYDCIVVGAGFGGLCLAGRLRAMGIKYVVVEKNDHVGDNWRQRYESARFHTTKYWSEMPHGAIFADKRYNMWLGRDELAEGYAEYARRHDINVELSTALKSASRNEQRNLWTVTLRRTDGTECTLQTTHLVFATGANGVIPFTPELSNREDFKGIALHSSEYVNASAWKGLQGVVIGTANTAHDVAEDMLNAGMSSVTMVQRGDTLVTPVEWHEEGAQFVYNDKIDVENSDRETMVQPLSIIRLIVKTIYMMKIEADPRFDALERAGFRVDRGGDLFKNLSTTFGG